MSLENLTQDERNSLALKKLFNHPEVGDQAKRLYKKAVPDASFPELDAADKREAERAATTKQIQDLEEKVQMQEITARRDKHFAEMRAKGFDPLVVEKVMTEEKISSYDTAMKYISAQNANSAATPANMTPLQMPEDWKDIAKNPKAWSQAKAFEAINELKAKRGQF